MRRATWLLVLFGAWPLVLSDHANGGDYSDIDYSGYDPDMSDISDFTSPPSMPTLAPTRYPTRDPTPPTVLIPTATPTFGIYVPPEGISSSRAVMRDGTRSSEKESSGKVKAAAVPVVAGVVVVLTIVMFFICRNRRNSTPRNNAADEDPETLQALSPAAPSSTRPVPPATRPYMSPEQPQGPESMQPLNSSCRSHSESADHVDVQLHIGDEHADVGEAVVAAGVSPQQAD